MSGSWFGLMAAFAVTLGLLALAVWLLRRVQGGAGWTRRSVPLKVIQRVSVGPKQGVALLQVVDRVLVVSMAEGGMRLLTELTEAERERLAAKDEAPAPPARPTWRSVLGIGLALLVTAGALAPTASAQTQGAQAPVVQAPSAPGVVAATAGRPVMPGPVVNPPAPPKVDIRLGEGADQLHLTGTVGLVVFMGLLTLLPMIVLLMTSFTRILIVLHFLRSALGTQTAPPTQLLVALSVLLTGVVMNPVLTQSNQAALQPYLEGRLTQVAAYQEGVKPFRAFMLANTREQDLALFIDLAGQSELESIDDVPLVTVVSAFVTSELRTAFQMGFVIFLPFVVLDVIVGAVLMSLGMFMLPPVMVSLPFKLLLFVLADGWTLVVKNLVTSFRH